MTERLYFLSDSLIAEVEVLACTATGDGYAVELRATPFHPQGGGQPSDTGWLGTAEVLHVVQDGERILHHVNRPLQLGRVLARIDEKRRLLHSRLHSAGHLIGHIGEVHGWQPVKAHHWPGEGKIEFVPGLEPRPLDGAALQAHFDALVEADLALHSDVDADGQRQVRFGEDIARYACGGTHVRSTRTVGQLSALGIKEKKGRLLVSYDMAGA
ncbi:alanyl-tRNA editing protein [Pseudomonas oryzihabitans]|uniref:alanyl-tRNA editing protein n=1 Tax=Pseudomonas oryzihabitans TaxID=47885 RepID=UPI0028953C5B|nr:alanyl-tRNA editing protein [Pseudomonas oryzihabitans]MDT3719363.1 alanyl-tRNA editing protein [Pseudomonas oryzihabitans]